MKIKCPKCNHEFETLENSAVILKKPKKEVAHIGALFMSAQQPQEIIGSKVDDVTYGIRCGYKDIFKSIDKHKGATWTELKSESKVSTATLAKRLHEGKNIGLIDEDIRKSTGKKIYKLRQ